MRFLVTITQGEDGYIVVECPSLPGCISQGKSKEEALANIREAIELSMETRKAHQIPGPFEVAEIEVGG